MSGDAAAAPRRVSYSQNGEDVRAWRALRDVQEVFYVEVGASDPLVDSLTAALSAEGGRGILLEADPTVAEQLRRARPRDTVVAAAASARPGVLVFHDMDRRGWGSVAPARAAEAADHVVGTLTVPAVRLADVLDELATGDVHFLSVDVEGHEAEVLAGAELHRHRPWVVCVESTLPNSRTQAWHSWDPGLVAEGYRFVAFDGLNRWYVAEERAELADRVAEPFGVLDRLLDGWVPADVAALEDRIASRDRDVAAMEQALGELHRAVEDAQGRVQQLTSESARAQDGQRAAEGARARAAQDLVSRDAELAALRGRADAAEARSAHLQAELARLTASKSWRMTRPVREVLHVMSTKDSLPRPRGTATHAVFLADRALQRHPERREAVISGLSRLPVLEARLRRLAAVPIGSPAGTATALHATADARVRRGVASRWRHLDTAGAEGPGSP